MKPSFKQRIRFNYERPLLPALFVFIALMVIIFVSWKTAMQDIATQRTATVNANTAFAEAALRQRFNIYEDTLRSANGLFLSSDFVSRDEWKTFVNSLMLPARYPGVLSVGYVKLVPLENRDAYVNSVHEEGITSFLIYPDTTRKVYAPITYVVPTAGQSTSDRTSPALGYDMYSDPVRKTAMDQAVASGLPTLSGKVNLTKAGSDVLNGFILYLPSYTKNMPLTNASERQQALNGFFYAPFVSDVVFSSVFPWRDPSFGFIVHDGLVTPNNVIYKTESEVDKPLFIEVNRTKFNLHGRDWTIVYKANDGLVPYTLRLRPWSTVIGGTFFAAILAFVIYLLIQRRTRELTYEEKKKLDEAKDELLSLASHQLRTPATAVKQYISMVKDGFAGAVTSEQQTMLQMAYDSNERQLTIVDELLYVARVDAGKATLKLESVDISALIQSVMNDLASVIKNRNQTVSYIKPTRAVEVEADSQYLRMIFENLLSNASKYSYENTQIKIILKYGNKYIRISFIDEGVGINSKDFGAVFIKFSRIPNELSRQIAGSGIGLYLAKQLALLHNGDIDFISSVGKGSTFTVTLPKNRSKD